MIYEKGDRVELISTTDPHSDIEPRTRGTVTGTDILPPSVTGKRRPERQVHVDWDDGSKLSMVLSQDTIRKVEENGK